MRVGKLISAVGTVLALVLGTVHPATGNPGSVPRANAGESRSVTLLTGDKVIVSQSGAARTIKPAAGREHLNFQVYQSDDHMYVIPADAFALVATGRVDRRLFDVRTLIEFGYDDASRNTLPVIVTYDGAARANLAAAASVRELPSINGAAIAADKAGTAGLWQAITTGGPTARGIAPGVRKLWLDGKRKADLDRSVPQIGAPAAWAAGFTGAGVTIAVLDTGVDQTHPDLATQEAAERNFTDAADAVDRFGHGTHVASIAAGTGAKADGKFTGVAFGSKIVDAKVLNDFGFGQDSWIIEGMQWAAEQGAKVANLSLGGFDLPGTDPLEEAVNTLSARHGILFVIAAGNSGSPESIGSPGSADAALTVGAINRDDSIAGFSSRGPRSWDGAIKPDITAPGVGIAAAKAAEGFIGDPVADGYVGLSGTSMATPHVAGAAAILAQQHPDWTGAQLKAIMTASAEPNPALTVYDQGSGRVDLAKAITQTITTQPTNVSLGTVAWPHDDDQPVTTSYSYHNPGGTGVTLDLKLETKRPDGKPAPDGVITLSTNKITVPAGGRAQVAVTGDTRRVTDGAYTGTIVATGGAASVVTPVAITREVESYNLTVNARGLNGAPTADYGVAIIGLDDDRLRFAYKPDGSASIRLPKGRYLVDTVVISDAGSPTPRSHWLTHPALSLTRDQAVDAPASAAKPIRVTTPDPAATLVLGQLGYDIRTAGSRWFKFGLLSDPSRVTIAGLGPALPGSFLTTINTQWTVPSGAFYGLAWFVPEVPTGFSRDVKQKDLATVNAEWAAVVPNRTGVRFAEPNPATGATLALSSFQDVPMPGRRTEYYNTDGTVWRTGVIQLGPDQSTPEAELISGFRQFRAGHTHRARFNHAVFGPAFPRTGIQPWAARFNDVLVLNLPLFGDGSFNGGISVVDSASMKLFRDGDLVGEQPSTSFGVFEVPAAESDYRLTVEAARPGIFDLTTKLSAAWTFRSGHVDGIDPASLPLSAIRFTPPLDANNSAPAGRPYLIPVALQRQSGDLARPHRITVEVSYDEGKTWRTATMIANLAALVHHPANATSVSLRAKATERDGTTVEHTIIRAYKLR